jgi:hypothetical protein
MISEPLQRSNKAMEVTGLSELIAVLLHFHLLARLV